MLDKRKKKRKKPKKTKKNQKKPKNPRIVAQPTEIFSKPTRPVFCPLSK